MKNKKEKSKSKLVLLNVDSFGIEKNLNSNSNLYKMVSLENWKKLISFKNSSKIIEYQNKGSNYQKEFFDNFGFQNKVNSNTFADFTMPFQEIYKAVSNTISSGQINNVHMFLYINDDFANIYWPVFANFIRQLNLFLFETKFKKTDTNFFHLNLIIEKPINNIDFFDNKIEALLKNNFNLIINSITTKNGFSDMFYLNDQIEDYFNKVMLLKNTAKFYSVQDFIYEETIQRAAKDVITTVDITNTKVNNNDLILYFNFDYNILTSLSKSFDTLFIKNNLKIINLPLRIKLEQTFLSESNNDIKNVIDKNEHKTIVLGERNILFLNKIFFGNNRYNLTTNTESNNSYHYIYNNAKMFFENIESNLNNANIILANWNIFTEAKKYFGFYEWLFALSVFDFYIYKITRLLDKNKTRWIFFSTSFGFDKSFKLKENDLITVPFLSNQFYSYINSNSHANWGHFKKSLLTEIKITNRSSLKNTRTKKVTLSKNLFKQQKDLSLVYSDDDFFEYIKKWMPKINVDIYKKYQDNVKEDDASNNKFKIEKISWDKFVDISRRRINTYSIFESMCIDEKNIFETKFIESDKLLYKLIMFYYQNSKIIKSVWSASSSKVKKNPSSNLANNLISSYDTYFNHIINIQEVISEQKDQVSNFIDIQFFKNEFYETWNNLRQIQLLRFNKFKNKEFRYMQAMILRNKKNELLLRKLKKWEVLHNKIMELDNLEYQESFDINKWIKLKETKEDFTEFIEITNEEEIVNYEDDF